MGRHAFISLIRHSERKVCVSYLSVLLISYDRVVTCSPEWSKNIMSSLKNILGVH